MGEAVTDGQRWLRVPVGPEAPQWSTRVRAARVLFVVHNVTSATRLLDVLPLFDADPRVQCLATCTGSSPYLHGVPELLADAGLPVLPWEQAVETPVDLAVSASYGGELHLIRGKLAILSHGIGYNKRLPTPDTGHRTPDTGSRGRRGDAGRAPVFGLSPEWLLRDGVPVATATVLSHPEQLARLRHACPPAARTAVLAGDPCFDRLLAALPHRDSFRRALGVSAGQRLVVVNSTWGPRSLFGDADDVFPRLLESLTRELPVDSHRCCAVLHPNIWHGHGPGQVRAWLRRAEQAGLTVVPPLGPWRQVLAAADAVIGDHGSVTYYAAALGTPVLLGAFPEADLDPASPVAELGRTAPRLHPYEPLLPQLDELLARHRPDRYAQLTALASSSPGGSAALLRRTFYGLIGLAEPGTPAYLPRLLDPSYGGLPSDIPPASPLLAPLQVLTHLRDHRPAAHPEIAVTRHAEGVGAATYPPPAPSPEPTTAPASPPPAAPTASHASPHATSHTPAHPGAHTAVHEDVPDATRLALADLVLHDSRPEPAAWTQEAMRRHRHCAMAACVTAPDTCLVRIPDGRLVTLTAAPGADGHLDLCDPAVYASALYAWYERGKPVEELLDGLVVVTGGTGHHVQVTITPPR
ncbi:hypothetical protein [Streptomyces monomycini]|uniref:hypothetical protein n=1 Tax=Streptomyces monomycini TaxID=371720 RepID=UPI000A82DA93|nr:hypothetical protein [Streptomyces monomycini]